MDIDNKIKFKSKKRNTLRQKIKEEDSDDDNSIQEVSSKLTKLKKIQKLRERPNGVSLVGLALGKKVDMVDEIVVDNPFNLQVGGLEKQTLKSDKKVIDDAYDTGIGTQFSVETNKCDEDEEMMKFIEDQLSKRKGNDGTIDMLHKKGTYMTPEEAALQAVPTHLRESSTKRSEEMLSNQMLSGIPEVDLGIEAKIKNIEATEEAKLKLLWEKENKKDGPSSFVPTNMAVNFVQHNRFNVDQSDIPVKKPRTEEIPKKKEDKATDDYHYEKFKKQFRR